MTDIRLVMPFSRPWMADILRNAYRPMNIILHPIMFIDESCFWGEGWIEPLVIPEYSDECGVQMPGCYKRNWFIKNFPIRDDDYYLTVDDDDMYEDGVFDAVKGFNEDIVIISMKRGDHVPDIGLRGYPTSTLYARPENVRVGGISTQQSFVKGRIFKKYLFDDNCHYSDGLMAIKHKEDGEQTRYEPDLYALFNYYEPGRWEINNGNSE